MKDSYRDIASKYLHEVDYVAPIRAIRVKSKTKSWFDIDVLNTIQNLDQHYKKLKLSSKEIDKEKPYFEEKITENKNNTKEL